MVVVVAVVGVVVVVAVLFIFSNCIPCSGEQMLLSCGIGGAVIVYRSNEVVYGLAESYCV